MLSKRCVSTTHHGVLIYTPQKHTLSCVILRTKGVFGEHTMVCSGNTLVFTVSRKVSSVHDRIVPYWSVRSPAYQTLSCQERVLDPFRTYAFFVLEMQLFFRFQKKIATTRNVFESFLTVHTNTLYRCENVSKPVLAVDEGVV